GATLYSMLTGKAPFTDPDHQMVLKQVAHGEFPPPRQVRPEVAPALEAICLKAMALRPEDRYATPRALADDIEHWLADEPVTALPETRRQRLARFLRRHRAWTQAAAVVLVLVSVVSLVAAGFGEGARRRVPEARVWSELAVV